MNEAAGPAKRILVVDDDPDIRETLADVFANEGYDVGFAAHGAEALEQLRGRPHDLIVLDLMMPVMSGWEFREAQLQEPAIAGVPVIVVSAARAPRPVSAAAFLPKPFDLDAILDLAKRLTS